MYFIVNTLRALGQYGRYIGPIMPIISVYMISRRACVRMSVAGSLGARRGIPVDLARHNGGRTAVTCHITR